MGLQRWIPDIETNRERLFCRYFSPMSVSALFLVMGARAQLEVDSSIPLPHPPMTYSRRSSVR